ncbi:MAG: hypothetical protein WA817_09145 [Candidatus Acidiferrum sp.]
MNLRHKSKTIGHGFLVLLLSLMLPLFVSAQNKKPPAPAPKAPAPHPASTPHTNTTHTNNTHTNTTHTNTTHTNANTAHTNTNGAHTNNTRTNSTTRTTTTTRTNTTRGGAGNTHTTTTTRTTTMRTASGGRNVTHADGSTHSFNNHGARTSVTTRNGASGHFDSRGHVTSIHAHGMTINHGAHGERRFETRGRDGGRLVGYGHGRGYAEHGYMRGGRPYMRRTYYYGGRRYAYAYRGAYWHGVAYYGYVPPYYYGPHFYAWAYNPWAAPIAWSWGWGGAPWYGYYGAYFVPAPVYATPSLWLADYLIAANLQAAYEAHAAADANAAAAAAAAPPPDSGQSDQPAEAANNAPVALSPEVKQAIADEVKAQVEAELKESGNPNPPPASASTDQVPAALDPAHRTFVVSTVLNPALPDGTECSLSPGDVLTRIQDAPDANQNVNVLVSSSQKGDCASGAQVPVAVQDLQDMQNDFRAKIDEGLSQMAANQGKNGMPTGPAADKKPSPDGQVQADLTVGDDLKAQQQNADQTEQDVKAAASSSGSGGGGGGND